MLNSSRERLLAVIFSGAIAVVMFGESIGGAVLSPLTETHSAIHAAHTRLLEIKDQAATVERALSNLREVGSQSLPADPGKASVLYQSWLVRHLEQTSIASAIVTPGPAIAERNIGHRIPFTVQCSASTISIARFLDLFYATPLLHRITNLNIASASEGQTDHRITMNIEAIAFDSAATIDTLPEPKKVPEGASLLTTLTEDDIFRRRLPVPTLVQTTPSEVTSEPVAITETRTEPPAPDPLQSVRFVASVWNGQHREAWLVDQRSNNEQTVLATSRLEFPGIKGTVIAVDGDTLQLELEGQQRVIQLGRTLAEITSTR